MSIFLRETTVKYKIYKPGFSRIVSKFLSVTTNSWKIKYATKFYFWEVCWKKALAKFRNRTNGHNFKCWFIALSLHKSDNNKN